MDWSKGILKTLESLGLEPDQRLRQAINVAAKHCRDNKLSDAQLFHAICKLNPRGLEHIPIQGFESLQGDTTYRLPSSVTNTGNSDVGTGWSLEQILDLLAKTARRGTVGTSTLLRIMIERSLEFGDTFSARGYLIDALALIYGADSHTPLAQLTEVRNLLHSLRTMEDGSDDFQYVLSLESKGMVFRIVTKLGDYVQQSDSGVWVPQRALLTHFDKLGLFTIDSIEELEEMINNPRAKEQDFQQFFERYPHFLRRHDYREVYPHIYLTREDTGPLIPDFILTNRESQDAAIVELKRSYLKRRLIRKQDNRVRFADAILEARAQLLEYRDWFERDENRERTRAIVGMRIYRPRLMVVIGRASEFRDEVERAKLRSQNPDIEVITYDDILGFARERRVFLEMG